ncbi:hypothetical protein DFH08DRAFT_857929 [Mycena albidolilacea]|uniref:G-protein coupled receptors family 2 profile 2 domain-containing protein n=1 Tax=Mycena albidolilacea TaxID=1033008 RepID=A0AAD7EU30_9AGAR|nr:hypothetical protein DFH08DRAFT_857929 [Mycena albidolilacea]
MGLAVPSITFIVLILAAYAWTAWNPVSRPYLNRVSFRLLVYALIANLAYSAGMISGLHLKAGAACNGSTFFTNSCLMFAGVMFFCMALNLQLVVVYRVNGQKMERYYIGGAILLTLACNVPPYAAGALGFWELNQTCWFNSPDPTVQLRWFFGTQGFWMFLMAAGEVLSFLTVVGFMAFRHRVTASVMSDASTLSQPPMPIPPIVLYRKMILRVGLYPLFSCFLNITGAILDLHTVLDPAFTEVNWRLGIVDLLVYDLRPLMYATLAATDPSFLSALRALRHPESATDFPRVQIPLQRSIVNTWSSGSTSTMVYWSNDYDTATEAGPKPESTTDIERTSEFTRQI